MDGPPRVLPQNITLMKYQDASTNWTALPTTLTGYDSNYYYYSAASNSFSTYAISYSSANALGSGAVKVSLPSGYTTYFYAGSTNTSHGSTAISVSWTKTSTANYHSGSGATEARRNATVGYATSNTGTFTGQTTNSNNIVVGFGTNVIEGNGAIFSANTGTTATTTSNILRFTVATSNSFVVIVSAISNHTLSSFTTTAPGSKVLQSNSITKTAGAEWAGIMVVNSLAAGTYTVTTTASAKAAIAQSAFVFPFYSVTFNDVPATAFIATNGVNQANGNTIAGLLGTGTINAIAPQATNSVFSIWTASSSANALVLTPTSTNTFLTVEGDATVTANFNSITTFTETGLPGGSSWNVIYNSITATNSLPPNDANVVFNKPWWGDLTYSIPDQVVGGTDYVPTSSSGTFGAGNTISVIFAASACYISVSSTTLDFGSIDPGSNVPTANAITVTDNGGTVPSNILIAGGLGTLSPYNGIWLGTSASNQIGISNTLYSLSSQPIYTGTTISNTPVDTLITIPNPGGGSASNTLYLGMGVPGGSPADTYTTNIVIENTC